MSHNKLVSIVIPCYNEEKNINRMFTELMKVMEDHHYDYEIVAVNDGSKDNTWGVIKEFAQKHDKIHGINLTGNFGQSCAYMAGFDNVKGDYVVTFNADLEMSNENILKVIEYLDEGYDFVNTNRSNRWGGDEADRKVKSGMANQILSRISGVDMKDRGSGLKGYKTYMLNNLRLYGDMHRFIPDYLSVYNAKMIEFDVKFKDRDYGVSAYKGVNRTIQVLLDIVTLSFMLYFAKKPFYAMPGRLFGFAGALIAGVGGLGALYLTFLKLMGESIGGRPLLTASLIMIVIGIQSIMVGMIGELMMRVYFESNGRKTYAVREKSLIMPNISEQLAEEFNVETAEPDFSGVESFYENEALGKWGFKVPSKETGRVLAFTISTLLLDGYDYDNTREIKDLSNLGELYEHGLSIAGGSVTFLEEIDEEDGELHINISANPDLGEEDNTKIDTVLSEVVDMVSSED